MEPTTTHNVAVPGLAALYEMTTHFDEDPDWFSAPEMVERFLSHGFTLVEMGETSYAGEYWVVLHGTLPQFEALYETEARDGGDGGSSYPDWEEWSTALTLVPRQHASSVHHSGD